MTTATLNISKSLTVVTNNSAYMVNLSELLTQANKFDLVTINGIVKTEKFTKYLNSMIANGFKIISENWNRENEIAVGASDFSITLSK
jgi:hypothetical protein